MNHRRPPLPESWNDEPGICRWCGCCIFGMRGENKGKPLFRRRWHSRCVTEYQFLFWPGETANRLRKERGCCEDCGEKWGLEVHHIIPLSEYPHDASDPYRAWRRENLALLCHDCHVGPTGRHAQLREEKQPQMRLFSAYQTEKEEDA